MPPEDEAALQLAAWVDGAVARASVRLTFKWSEDPFGDAQLYIGIDDLIAHTLIRKREIKLDLYFSTTGG